MTIDGMAAEIAAKGWGIDVSYLPDSGDPDQAYPGEWHVHLVRGLSWAVRDGEFSTYGRTIREAMTEAWRFGSTHRAPVVKMA